MPSPTMLPKNWNLAIIDIKDCFFNIPLHPDDAPRFAFSVPNINREAPRRRYHWKVLPQGMKNSPVICQWYVSSLLTPVRAAAHQAIIHHYMDDVLVCAPSDDLLTHALDLTVNALVAAGFELQEQKIQRMPPWKYLGLQINKRTIVPQKLAIKTNVETLADAHQLCGALNWVRPWLGLTTEDLAPLFNLLKGGEGLSSPRFLTPEAEKALEKVQHLMSTRQASRCDPDLPFSFVILGNLPHLHGLIFQWDTQVTSIPRKDRGKKDPLLIIEWVFLSHQRSKRMTKPQELMADLIRKARIRIRDLAGCDFNCIHIPIRTKSGQITKVMLEHLLQENEALQFALDGYAGQISVHRPAHKIFNADAQFQLTLKSVQSRRPLEALTVFTDASGGSHKSVMTWKDPQTQRWESDVAEVEGSPQIAELDAVVRVFERFPEPLNIVTDSAYVAGVVSRAENSILQEVTNVTLFRLLSKLVRLISHREHPFYVMHVRSHTELPGFIAEGNQRADALAAPVAMTPLPDVFQQAKISHQLFHQNAPGLVRQFHLSRDQAKAIVATCPSCQRHAVPTMHAGVNPRGLHSNEIWQMDVTHIAEFGRLKYVHVSVDTFSGVVFASAHTGEKAVDVMKHLIQAFSFMGIPKLIKTDNGPSYVSRELSAFLQQWGVEHRTGIPYSPTGQAIVERTHQNIKRVLAQQEQIQKLAIPQIRLSRALFTLNFLNCSFDNLNPPIIRHFVGDPKLKFKDKPPVLIRDPNTLETQRPVDLITWGRGYACVASPEGPKWVPANCRLQASEGPTRIPVFLSQWLTTCLIFGLLMTASGWIVPQPKANVWRTLAMAMGQDHICLSQGSAQDPIASCLVGIPFQESELPPELLRWKHKAAVCFGVINDTSQVTAARLGPSQHAWDTHPGYFLGSVWKLPPGDGALAQPQDYRAGWNLDHGVMGILVEQCQDRQKSMTACEEFQMVEDALSAGAGVRQPREGLTWLTLVLDLNMYLWLPVICLPGQCLKDVNPSLVDEDGYGIIIYYLTFSVSNLLSPVEFQSFHCYIAAMLWASSSPLREKVVVKRYHSDE
ncbi:hypothetical protein HGM15179_007720 [Zosterops borbonicus]|uniref:Uncharacterized protein n=1 Tax=Zosterops borbonicus TaxID=364589 RepID=A0A8K1GJ14_9PASS|nr:hypothetical protein HGM15179_007720 [Zosterops borbonicus]